MAGDWIKMRIDLQTHPKVVRILSATESDKFRVIGGLHAVWCVFDTHTQDGVLDGYTAKTLDHIIGWDGFSVAMIDVGWLEETPQGLVMPEFSEHNGKSAKRRGEDQKRKRETRNCPQSVRKVSAEDADKKRTREEKEKNITPYSPPRFDDFWEKYPKKVAKVDCKKKWKAKRLDEKADEIISDIEKRIALHRPWVEGFIPNPLTYINQQRWEDEMELVKTGGNVAQFPQNGEGYDHWRKVGAEKGIHPGPMESERDYIARVKQEVGA